MDFKNNLITFICTGNICRSPMAEKLFLHAAKAEKEPISSLQATSAGVAAIHGNGASLHSLKVLKSVNLDLDAHESQPLTQEIVDKSFAIFCMTETHCRIVETNFETKDTQVHLMCKFLSSPKNTNIPDPFGQDLDAYITCRDSLVEAIPSIIDFLKKELSR